MFRVNKTEYANKTFRMPEPLLESLESVAQQQDISLNRLSSSAANMRLKTWNRVSKARRTNPT